MRNKQAWKPTKFVLVGDRWRASRNPEEIAISSRLIEDLTVSAYQEAIETYATGSLVDLGCGKVPLYGIYHDRVNSVTCVDWEHSLHGTEFIDYTIDLNSQLAFADSSFDTVLMTDVLENIRRSSLFWSEMARICKPGGHIIIGSPFLYWIHEQRNDYARYTKYNFIYECQQNNLEMFYLKEYGAAPEVLCCLLMKMMRKRKFTCIAMDRASRLFLSLKSIKKLSRKSIILFPLGYCMACYQDMSVNREDDARLSTASARPFYLVILRASDCNGAYP